ncbi:hypothetical protein D918_01931 [Trichuris suis]|nr:hypothetical protein D918_01931 [Trichuris suis]
MLFISGGSRNRVKRVVSRYRLASDVSMGEYSKVRRPVLYMLDLSWQEFIKPIYTGITSLITVVLHSQFFLKGLFVSHYCELIRKRDARNVGSAFGQLPTVVAFSWTFKANRSRVSLSAHFGNVGIELKKRFESNFQNILIAYFVYLYRKMKIFARRPKASNSEHRVEKG